MLHMTVRLAMPFARPVDQYPSIPSRPHLSQRHPGIVSRGGASMLTKCHEKPKIVLCRSQNLPGYREFRRIIVATESACGLMELRGPLLQRTLRGPGARKADGCPQPKHARLLLLRSR